MPAPVTEQFVAPAAPLASQEERRLVTTLFCDLVGFTPLAESLDPEEVREIQAAYFGVVTAQVARFGGIVEKYAGDAVLALFGVPLAHEDDPERAVLCGLGMQRTLGPVADDVRRRYGVQLAIRVGVNTGEVVSGSWDASGRQQEAVTGDAVNVAARIQAEAEAGAVLVGEQTMFLTRRRIRYGDEQRLTLKGKRAAVPAYRVLGTRDHGDELGGRDSSWVTPLVGRGRELETIQAAWHRAVAGDGQLLTLVGEPGVGKSRLAGEGMDRIAAADHPRILRGRCLSYGQSVSLWLIADLVRSFFSLSEDAGLERVGDTIARTVEETLSDCDETDRAIARDVLGEVLGLPPGESLVAAASPQVRRQALIRILGLLLRALAAEAPMMMVLEDLHWLDTASADILQPLLRDVPALPVLVLAIHRPGWTAPWSAWDWAQELTLQPLGEREAAVLAGAMLGGTTLSPQLEDHLRERAQGNPFFVEELMRYLRESGHIERREGAMELTPGTTEKIPSTLAEVLLARLDRLESQVKRVAQVGSVIGRSFAVRLLSRVMEREEGDLLPPLRSLMDADITYERRQGELEHVFRHALLRDTAYGVLVQRRRRELHLLVGQAIAALYPTDEYVEMIAYHYARTDEAAGAAMWLERAGDRARATFANDAAIGHYRDALERLERIGAAEPARADVELKLGTVLSRTGRYAEAEGMLERAIARYEAAGRLDGAALAVAEIGHAVTQTGRPEGARKRAEAMVNALSAQPPSIGAFRLQLMLADAFQNTGGYAEMLAAAERMEELAANLQNDEALGRARERRGAALLLLGRIEEARAALETAIRLLERVGEVRGLRIALTNVGEALLLMGDLTEAVQVTRRAMELGVRLREGRKQAFTHLNLAQLLLTAGEWDGAAEQIDRADKLAELEGTGAIIGSVVLHTRGDLALRRGEWHEARRLLAAAAEQAAGTFQQVSDMAQVDLAELDILEGRADGANDRLMALLNPQSHANAVPVLAWAQLEQGETERALELTDAAERESREQKTVFYLPEVLRIKGAALARLGRNDEARAIWTEGQEWARRIPNPYCEARILRELGMLDRREGLREAARRHLQEALDIFHRLGAGKDVEGTERELAALERSADVARG